MAHSKLQQNDMKIALFGNPGVGKSTLLNCLGQVHAFESGVNIGSGLTDEFQTRKIGNGVVLCDTPGLGDSAKQRKAAAEITKALQEGGRFYIIFVISLEAGRVKDEDMSTIKEVRRSAPQITTFGLIINKLSSQQYNRIHIDVNKAKVLNGISEALEMQAPPPVLFLPEYDQLKGQTNRFMEIKELSDFVFNRVQPVMIRKEMVQAVRPRNFSSRQEVNNLGLRLEEQRREAERARRRRDEERRQQEIAMCAFQEEEERRFKQLQAEQKLNELLQTLNMELTRIVHAFELEEMRRKQEADRAARRLQEDLEIREMERRMGLHRRNSFDNDECNIM